MEEYVGTLTMYFRNERGDVRAGHSETWRNVNAGVVSLSATFNCNQVLKDQSVASEFKLLDPDGNVLVWATILAPRFYRKGN